MYIIVYTFIIANIMYAIMYKFFIFIDKKPNH